MRNGNNYRGCVVVVALFSLTDGLQEPEIERTVLFSSIAVDEPRVHQQGRQLVPIVAIDSLLDPHKYVVIAHAVLVHLQTPSSKRTTEKFRLHVIISLLTQQYWFLSRILVARSNCASFCCFKIKFWLN